MLKRKEVTALVQLNSESSGGRGAVELPRQLMGALGPNAGSSGSSRTQELQNNRARAKGLSETLPGQVCCCFVYPCG